MDKVILDACCGGRMMWFDKNNPLVLYVDIRQEQNTLIPGRPEFSIQPDEVADFRNLPYNDDHFQFVIFDPPHLKRAGKNGWMAKKYGVLPKDWRPYLQKGFEECMRVLQKNRAIIF